MIKQNKYLNNMKVSTFGSQEKEGSIDDGDEADFDRSNSQPDAYALLQLQD